VPRLQQAQRVRARSAVARVVELGAHGRDDRVGRPVYRERLPRVAAANTAGGIVEATVGGAKKDQASHGASCRGAVSDRVAQRSVACGAGAHDGTDEERRVLRTQECHYDVYLFGGGLDRVAGRGAEAEVESSVTIAGRAL